jgi:3-oxoadipate enol-lactonase
VQSFDGGFDTSQDQHLEDRVMIGIPTVHVSNDGRQTWLRAYKHTTSSQSPIVLLHGLSLSADEQWYSLYPWLAERTSFIAIDHPGHGRSDPPKTFTIEDAAERAAEVIRSHFTGPAALVGFSLGGPVAMHVAARHPELVSGLVLASTTHHFDRSIATRAAMPVLETLMRSRIGDRMRNAETRASKLPVPIRGNRPGPHPRSVSAATRCLNGLDLTPLCNRIVAPSVAIITTTDRLIAPQRQRDAARLLNAPMLDVDGPHTIYERNPSIFADAIAAGIVLLTKGTEAT